MVAIRSLDQRHELLGLNPGALRLSAITVREVDRYKAAKLREGTIGPAQINKTLQLHARVLDVASEYDLLDGANPARGRRRRVKVPEAWWPAKNGSK